MKRSTKLVALLGAVMATATLGVAGWAFWTATGTGTASASVGTLTAPSGVTATQPNAAAGTVRLTWTAPAGPGDGPVDGYYLQRTGAASGAACGSSSTSLITATTCDDTGLAAGTYSYAVTAVWRSWTATSSPSAPITVTVTTTADTTTAVVSTTGSPSVAGQTVTYTATVSVSAPGSGTPTGNVQFLDATTPINVCGDAAGAPLASGASTATCVVTYSNPGTHNITARYLGAPAYNASPASVPVTQTVNQALPVTSLTITGSPTTYGSESGVTFAASVTPPHSGTPTGSVAVRQNATTLCTIALPAPSCATTNGALGASSSPYAITATYSGDANFSSSTSAARDLTVNKAALTITASGATMTYGGSVPLIAAGYAGFVNGDDPANLSPQPACSTTATTSSEVGSYPSTCSGAASTNYAFTYVTGSVTVTKASQTITFTSAAPTNAVAGGPTYTVTATSSAGSAVTFSIDSAATSICSVSGSTVNFTTAGICKINANQAGSANHLAAPQAQQSFAVAVPSVTISSMVRNGGNVKVNFTGTGTAGSSLTLTICKTNAFPCFPAANAAGTSTVASVPADGGWTSAQSSTNLDPGVTYYARAVQTSPTATSTTFTFTAPPR